MQNRGSSNAFQGTQASYVALAAIISLALALVISIWFADVSGAVALLGLIAVYTASAELLLLYLVFTPGSIVIDAIRLGLSAHSMGGRGWLITFCVFQMVAKAVGTFFAYSLHQAVSSGDGVYAPMNNATAPGAESNYQRVADPFAAYSPPAQPNTASQYQAAGSHI